MSKFRACLAAVLLLVGLGAVAPAASAGGPTNTVQRNCTNC